MRRTRRLYTAGQWFFELNDLRETLDTEMIRCINGIAEDRREDFRNMYYQQACELVTVGRKLGLYNDYDAGCMIAGMIGLNYRRNEELKHEQNNEI